MKNYYEILEVNRNASPEIIKVAYKLLVKKNHPDLKEGEEKQIAEEIIKEINEAYDVLSNPSKKAEYDQHLINETISQEQYTELLNENMNLKKELNYFNNLYNKNIYAKKQYSNMYSSDNHNSTKTCTNSTNTKNVPGINKNHIKSKLNDYAKTIIALFLTFLIVLIILKIPFINSFIINYLGDGYLIMFFAIIVFYIYFFRNKQ